jgi:Leucine-rich repeat (LRR) protein
MPDTTPSFGLNELDQSILKKIDSLLNTKVPFLGEREEKRDSTNDFDDYLFGFSRVINENHIDRFYFVKIDDIGPKITNLLVLLSKLTFLEELYLVDCNIPSIPNELGLLTDLKYLSIVRCNLTSLPEEIGQLKNLQTLGLIKNNLTSLPKSFFTLNQLRSVWIGNNFIKNISDSFENFHQLVYFSIAHNPIATVPKSLFNLKNVKALQFPKELRNEIITSLGITESVDKEPYNKDKFRPLQERYNYNQMVISFY